MLTHTYTGVRVRYADTDQMGYMYYGNYARLYEIGRVETLRAIGFSYRDMEQSGIIMPVYDNYSRYYQPARYDDELTIKVTLNELPKVKVVFKYEIFNQAGTLLNTGQTTLVFVNRDTSRPTRAPQSLVNLLTPYFQS